MTGKGSGFCAYANAVAMAPVVVPDSASALRNVINNNLKRMEGSYENSNSSR